MHAVSLCDPLTINDCAKVSTNDGAGLHFGEALLRMSGDVTIGFQVCFSSKHQGVIQVCGTRRIQIT